MKAVAVIGANYGDEGKGRIVDALSTPNTMVIRYNGGCQAGHTVVRDGVRHVFNQFGAGTFRHAPTYLGPEFICNPIMFRQEYQTLQQLGMPTFVVGIHPNCRITTPYDMIVNQQLERARGANRHGSCGLGIHETVLRSKTVPFSIEQASTTDKLTKTLAQCREFSFERLKSKPFWRGFEALDLATFFSNSLLSNYVDDLNFVLWHSNLIELSFIRPYYNKIIFEGAQGLGLDEFAPGFPHVTHSRTGLTYVLPLLLELGCTELEAIYVTRPYVTRHGAGPLLHEHAVPCIEDKTNVEHAWQGKLRTGDFDVQEIASRIKIDLSRVVPAPIKINVSLAVTCTDHMKMPADIDLLMQLIGAQTLYQSGSESGDIRITQLVSVVKCV